jgi:Protein of unknown function (DUF2795)
VERGSDKHSPMVDEALKHDTASLLGGSPSESRSQEGREQEGPAEGEPTPDARITGDPWASGDTLSLDDVNTRAELARHLDRAVFPARTGELVENARARHAPDQIVEWLSGLPDGLYETVGEVWIALGGKDEGGHAHPEG